MKDSMLKDSPSLTRDEFLQEINSLRNEIEILSKKMNDTTIRMDKKTNEIAVGFADTKFRLNNLEESTVTQLTLKEDVKRIMNSIDTLTIELKTFDNKVLEIDNKVQGIAIAVKKLENSIHRDKKLFNES